MRVLVLMPLAEQRGGGELMLVDLLRNAGSSEVEWRLVLFEEGPLVGEARALGVETTVIHTGRLRHVGQYIRSVAAIRRAAKDVDLVFSWMTKAHLYGSPAARLAGKPAAWFQLAAAASRSSRWSASISPSRSRKCT